MNLRQGLSSAAHRVSNTGVLTPAVVVSSRDHQMVSDESEAGLSRVPPVAVRRQLRREVGFGCPVSGCGNPYLEYHHFDPPWNEEHHHDPDRMIALCATHHAKADAFTVEQLRGLKSVPDDRPEVAGRFEWMRDEVLAIVGGNYYHETPVMVAFRGEPMIWFERDADNTMLLNLRVLTRSGEPRTRLLNNDWFIRGDPEDVESPPNGSYLRVRYANGDDVSVQFREWKQRAGLVAVHPRVDVLGDAVKFPLVTAEIHVAVGGSNIRFGPKSTTVGGLMMTGGVISRCGTGFAFS